MTFCRGPGLLVSRYSRSVYWEQYKARSISGHQTCNNLSSVPLQLPIANPTHIARFIAVEDGREHLGQLIDTTRDIGLDIVNGIPVQAFKINGSIFAGKVTSIVLTVDRLLSPVSKEECNYIRCLGLNYVDHANETGMALPRAPILFSKPRTCLSDPYPAVTPIPKCAQDGTSDYEAELAVVIGRAGRDIPEEEALEYVLGYTASNDVSARTLQMTTSQWGFSKGLDGSLPIGKATLAEIILSLSQLLTAYQVHSW